MRHVLNQSRQKKNALVNSAGYRFPTTLRTLTRLTSTLHCSPAMRCARCIGTPSVTVGTSCIALVPNVCLVSTGEGAICRVGRVTMTSCSACKSQQFSPPLKCEQVSDVSNETAQRAHNPIAPGSGRWGVHGPGTISCCRFSSTARDVGICTTGLSCRQQLVVQLWQVHTFVLVVVMMMTLAQTSSKTKSNGGFRSRELRYAEPPLAGCSLLSAVSNDWFVGREACHAH